MMRARVHRYGMSKFGGGLQPYEMGAPVKRDVTTPTATPSRTPRASHNGDSEDRADGASEKGSAFSSPSGTAKSMPPRARTVGELAHASDSGRRSPR